MLLISALVGAAITTPAGELAPAGLDKRCNGQNQFCNNGIPCCANLYCGSNTVCAACNAHGQICNNGVPCCSGLYCGTNRVCSACNSQGQICNNGVPCCSGLYCGTNAVCTGCNGQGQICNNGVPCCSGLYCGTNRSARGATGEAKSAAMACRAAAGFPAAPTECADKSSGSGANQTNTGFWVWRIVLHADRYTSSNEDIFSSKIQSWESMAPAGYRNANNASLKDDTAAAQSPASTANCP